jgi:hypothetical protein
MVLRRPRSITVLTPDGPEVVIISIPETRSLIARHLNAVRRYLELGDDRRLADFEDVVVVVDGREIDLVSDPEVIDRLAEGGEVWFELYRG